MAFNELNSVEHYIINNLSGVNLNNGGAAEPGQTYGKHWEYKSADDLKRNVNEVLNENELKKVRQISFSLFLFFLMFLLSTTCNMSSSEALNRKCFSRHHQSLIRLMSFFVIPREERYLEGRFPADYPDYKASVRRWV